MNPEPSTAVFDPEDPFFKQLRHRYYRLGNSRRRKILERIYSVPSALILNKDAEKEYLMQIAQEGKMMGLFRAIEIEEAEIALESEGPARAQG